MGDSACLMHTFSYPSGLSNEAKQGNLLLALGDSISFGRYMTESLSWEKWSTFSHKCYVEEAKSYAQPGSVAQKKAFFEAHYKTIAAKKAAEAEAALLEQANASNYKIPEPELPNQACNVTAHKTELPINEETKVNPASTELDSSVNGNGYSSDVVQTPPKVPAPPVMPVAPVFPMKSKKSLQELIHCKSAKEQDNSIQPVDRRSESSRVAPGDCNKTPARTPETASANGESNQPSATPSSSGNRRSRKQVDPLASAGKPTGAKWKILSAVLRTGERAARRKQKVQDAKDAQKVQLPTKLKEKAETGFKKLRRTLCFKAQTLPNFSDEKETPKNLIKNLKGNKQGRRNSSSGTFQV